MKRDMELVVKLLEYLEEREAISVLRAKDIVIPGYDTRVIAYHLRRMYEAGLLDAEVVTSKTTPERIIDVLPFGLTWDGHEFLDAVRNQTVRKKVWARFGELPFTLLKELALALARRELGLPG